MCAAYPALRICNFEGKTQVKGFDGLAPTLLKTCCFRRLSDFLLSIPFDVLYSSSRDWEERKKERSDGRAGWWGWVYDVMRALPEI